jgi:outer membrane biosynthesis protein TonB
VVDPIARVTFDRDGTVIEVVLIRSSGASNVDGPVRESLYRWKARGEQIQQWDAPRIFEFSLLLGSR